MLADQGISQITDSTRIFLILGALGVVAWGRHLLFLMIRILIVVFIIATLVGAVVIAKLVNG